METLKLLAGAVGASLIAGAILFLIVTNLESAVIGLTTWQ